MKKFTPRNTLGTGYLYIAQIHEIRIFNRGSFGTAEVHFVSDKDQSVMVCLSSADRELLITALQNPD